jgi:hypothetical protein
MDNKEQETEINKNENINIEQTSVVENKFETLAATSNTENHHQCPCDGHHHQHDQQNQYDELQHQHNIDLNNLFINRPNKFSIKANYQIEDSFELYGIKYVQYKDETQMPLIMNLITKDLSEPYSIYTYRYFIHNWPYLCFLVGVFLFIFYKYI